MRYIVGFVLSCMSLCTYAASSSDALAALSKLQPTPLYFITRSVKPTDGLIYADPLRLKVLQALPDGILAGDPDDANAKIIFISTTRRYVDNDTVAAGLYQADGTYSYFDTIGVKRTIYKFRELPQELYTEVMAIRKDRDATAQAVAQTEAQQERQRQTEQAFQKSKARIAAEEALVKAQIEAKKVEQTRQQELMQLELEKANRIAEAQQKAAQEELAKKPAIQKLRAEFARVKMSPFDFNIKHHYVIQRSVRKGANLCGETIQGIEVIDPDWHKLAECHAKQDWLGMLNIIDDEEYDEYPEEKTITLIANELANRRFKIKLNPDKRVWRLAVSCRKHQSEAHGGQCKDESIGKWNKSSMGLMPRRDPSDPFSPECITWRIFYTKWYISSDQDSIDRFVGREQGKPYGCVSNVDDATATRYEEWLRSN